MTYEQVFSSATNGVLLGWLLLAVAPRWRWTARLTTWLGVGSLAVAYVFLALPGLLGLLAGDEGQQGGFSSLHAVRELFTDDALLLAGWLHYLAFDLFVGTWMTSDALRLRLPRWLVIPCLPLTLFAGPAGLCLYLLFRATAGRKSWGRDWFTLQPEGDHDAP